MLTLLAQNSQAVGTLVLAVAGLAILATIALFVVRAVRRWTRDTPSSETFTMQDLRTMRASGQISEAEFQSMRALILGRYAANSDDADSGASGTQRAKTDGTDGPDSRL